MLIFWQTSRKCKISCGWDRTSNSFFIHIYSSWGTFFVFRVFLKSQPLQLYAICLHLFTNYCLTPWERSDSRKVGLKLKLWPLAFIWTPFQLWYSDIEGARAQNKNIFQPKNATFEMHHLAANFIKPKWTQFSFWEILLFTTSKLLDQIKSYSWKTKFWISHSCARVSIKKCRKDGITFDPVKQFWFGKKQNCSEWKSGSFRFNKVGPQMAHFKSCIFGWKILLFFAPAPSISA